MVFSQAQLFLPSSLYSTYDVEDEYCGVTIGKFTLLANIFEITDRYLESEEIIKSFQSTWAPYVGNSYEVFWNKWASPQKAAEIYARTVNNFADNAIVTTRIANKVMFTNMEALKTIIEHRRDDIKEFSRMAVNTAKRFEQTSRNAANPSTQQ